MTWDFMDQLKEVDLGGGGTAYYVYSSGQRVRKVIENGTLTKDRLYLGSNEIYREKISGSLDLERATLHISDDTGRIALVDTKTYDGGVVGSPTNEIRYQIDNHLQSASLELDNSAAIISYEEFHAFGTSAYRLGRTSTEVSQKRYRYVCKERDDESGLYYYGARYYAAWLGKFISVDPKKDDYPMWSSFVYAGNMPITMTDVNGEGPGGGEDPSALDIFMDFNFKSLLDSDDNSVSGYASGLMAGLGDGVLETAQMGVGLLKGLAYVSPIIPHGIGLMPLPNPIFFTESATEYREELKSTFSAFSTLLSNEEGREMLYGMAKEMLGEYWDDLTFENSATDAGYVHGKILFEVLTAVLTAGGSSAATGAKSLTKAAKEGTGALVDFLKKQISQYEISFDLSGPFKANGQLSSGVDPSKLIKIKKKAQGGVSESIRDMMRSQKVVKIDMMDKGVHFNVGKIELRAVPDHQGGVTFKPVHPGMAKKNQAAYQKAVKEATQSLGSSEFRGWLSKHAQKGMEMAQETGNAKALEFKFLLNALKAME